MHCIGEHAGGTGVRGLRHELFGIEVHVEQARGTPCQPRAIGRALDRADRRIVETLLDIAGAEFAGNQIA